MASSTSILDYVGRGTHAARPATPPVGAGAASFYFETDTGHTFVWSGTAWVQVDAGASGVSSLNTLTGALSIAAGLGIAVSAAGTSVTVAQKGSSTTARSTVAASVAAVSLLAANASRVGVTITNDQGGGGTATLYVAVGASGSTTDFTYELGPGQSVDLPYMYTGSIYGVWSAATGNARVTEYT